VVTPPLSLTAQNAVASELARVGLRSGTSQGNAGFQVVLRCRFWGCYAAQREESSLATGTRLPQEMGHHGVSPGLGKMRKNGNKTINRLKLKLTVFSQINPPLCP